MRRLEIMGVSSPLWCSKETCSKDVVRKKKSKNKIIATYVSFSTFFYSEYSEEYVSTAPNAIL